MSTNSFGQVGKPDFAFPATVSQSAKADLRRAEAANDPHLALNALIRLTVADNLIDPDSMQESIRTAEQTAARFNASAESGLYDCLLATMYDAIYDSNRWKYDRRELPLEPLPDDITEWSGEQFKAKIRDLSLLALGKADALAKLKITDYADIITADKLTAVYYPTVLDFVCSAVSNLDNGEIRSRAIAIGKKYAPEGSPAAILWISEEKEPTADPQYFLDQYERYSDNPAASLLLGKYVEAREFGPDEVEAETEDGQETPARKREWLPAWAVPTIDAYLKRCPTAYMADWLKSLRNGMMRQTANVRMPAYCMVGDTVTVDCDVTNAPEVTVALYYIPEASARLTDLNDKFFASRKPQAEKTLEFADKAPFKAEGKVKFLIKKNGYYVAVPKIGVKHRLDYANGMMRCVPVYPFALNNLETPIVGVVNPRTGEPIGNAAVKVTSARGDVSAPHNTDGKGIAEFSDIANRVYYGEVSVAYKGQTYTFNGIYPRKAAEEERNERKAVSILTDRGLYHPGDKVHALIVASRMEIDKKGLKHGSVCADQNLTVRLDNANGQKVGTVALTTDGYGRATAEFTLPADGLTGAFTLVVDENDFFGTATIMVSDYRMPDFEIEVASTLMDTPSAGCVTLNGQAKYYSGMPVSDAKITVTLSRSPIWRWYASSDKVAAKEITADAEGKFSVTFTGDEMGEEKNAFYSAIFDAVSPSGTTASCQSTFTIGKKYVIELKNAEKIDGDKPFRPDIKVVDADGIQADIPLKWSLRKDKKTVTEGAVGTLINLKDIRPGQYEFKVEPVDTALAMAVSSAVEIYNVESGIAPVSGLWTLKNEVDFVPGQPIELLIATGGEATVYCMVNKANDLVDLQVMRLKPGYKNLKIELKDKTMRDGNIVLATVRDFKSETVNINLREKKIPNLKIVGETFRDKLIPGQSETWKLRLVDSEGHPVNGAMALDMFNKALDAVYTYSPALNFADIYRVNGMYINFPYAYLPQSSVQADLPHVNFQMLQRPEFNFYGYSLASYDIVVRGFASAKNAAMVGAVNDMADAGYLRDEVEYDAEAEEEKSLGSAPAENGGGEARQPFEYRDADVPLAIWAPTLSTDADGNICYSFTVPNANASWKLTALAWTKNLEKGKLVHDFVASKPIMVTPNPPRFLRQGDVCTIMASVLNNTDSACVASTKIELFNPANGAIIADKAFTDSLAASGSATVSIDVKAGYDLPAIGYRIRTDNGYGFADGEQSVIPVLTSKAALVETWPFYLNPGEKTYQTVLPEEKGARLSLTFCENPTWTIVSALPGMRQMDEGYPNSAAACLFSAAVSKGIVADNPDIAKALKQWRENPADSALVSMLEKNQDLKIAMLNATPWVQAAQSQTERMAALAMILDSKEADKAIDMALASLKKLQRPDGGWAWGEWCERSSLWTTLNVLDMLGQLRSAGWLTASHDVADIIAKAVKYCDGAVEEENMTYAIVRRYFSEIPVSLNGNKVIAQTTNAVLRNWKKYSDPALKAIAAEVLYLNDYPAKSKELMRSISEFGVMSASQGLTFPSVNSLFSYALILRAYALIEPSAPQVDGLRQQLIIRKQGSDWGASVVTGEVVSAILSTGTKWTVPAVGAEITADGEVIKGNKIETATGALRIDLSRYGGKKLDITTSGVGPAYGAVFAQYEKSMTDVKASSCDDLDIEKSMTVRQADGSWQYAGDLKVGDRVKVQLTIHSKRNLQYVEIIDERPASFQPADQIPGWIWAEGVGFYRENRDAYTALHVESLRPGTYILTYEMNVGQAGVYSSGVATIQSQYAPEISAHSSGTLIRVESAE